MALRLGLLPTDWAAGHGQEWQGEQVRGWTGRIAGFCPVIQHLRPEAPAVHLGHSGLGWPSSSLLDSLFLGPLILGLFLCPGGLSHKLVWAITHMSNTQH